LCSEVDPFACEAEADVEILSPEHDAGVPGGIKHDGLFDCGLHGLQQGPAHSLLRHGPL